jgi:hypothetical protein
MNDFEKQVKEQEDFFNYMNGMLKFKKLIYSNDTMAEFNAFFGEQFKVVEVGTINTTLDRKELHFCKCPYDGMALNRTDGTIYLKYENEQKEQFILLENQTIIIENEVVYTTSDTGLVHISKNDIFKELERLKDYEKLTNNYENK